MPNAYNILIEPAPIVIGYLGANGVISAVGNMPAPSTDSKINGFAYLPVGWEYGRGGPLSAQLINSGKYWNRILESVLADYTEAVPGDRELTIAGAIGDHYFEIIIDEDRLGRLAFSFSYDLRKKPIIYQDNLTEAQILEMMMSALGAQWNAFGSFTVANTISSKTRFSNRPSETTMARSRWSKANVLWTETGQFAPTYGTTPSQASPTNHQYSGGSTQIAFLLTA